MKPDTNAGNTSVCIPISETEPWYKCDCKCETKYLDTNARTIKYLNHGPGTDAIINVRQDTNAKTIKSLESKPCEHGNPARKKSF